MLRPVLSQYDFCLNAKFLHARTLLPRKNNKRPNHPWSGRCIASKAVILLRRKLTPHSFYIYSVAASDRFVKHFLWNLSLLRRNWIILLLTFSENAVIIKNDKIGARRVDPLGACLLKSDRRKNFHNRHAWDCTFYAPRGWTSPHKEAEKDAHHCNARASRASGGVCRRV